MSFSDEEIAKRIARSDALKDQLRNTQQASLFLSEGGKIRCHASQNDLQQRSATLVQRSFRALEKSQAT